jgi:3-dehydroquinate dehydratase/shikimate dehydrogenase
MDSPHKPRVCISLCEPTVAALERAIAAVAELSELIEVRLDCLDPLELKAAEYSIEGILCNSGSESIFALRPVEQGGRRALDYGKRYVFWYTRISRARNGLCDIELDLAEGLNSEKSTKWLGPVDWSRIICSHHDFVGLPADLAQIYQRMTRTPARVLKIAVQADDAMDCLPVFQVLERARADDREMIAIAMGTAGLATRILGPSRGAFLTYASPDGGTATAPGQISISELKEVYRLDKIDRQTALFGIVGLPVSHSVSPLMHNAAFAAAGTNAVYVPFETRDVKTFIKRMIHPRTRELDWNVRGLSVTAPHKFAVMDQLDWIEPAAREIGAVNTIVVQDDSLHGYNTDATGFIKPLIATYDDLRGARCAVIGAGGAASAALWSFNEAGAKTTLFARDTTKASALAERFGIDCVPLAEASFEGFDVVVNATPLGTAGQYENETPAAASQLRGTRLVYDLVYNPSETTFLREARAAGSETLSGLAMLVIQAAQQIELWTGTPPPEDVMQKAAEQGLKQT